MFKLWGANAAPLDFSELFSALQTGMSEAKGHPITFVHFLRYGVPATVLTMVVATLDVWVRNLAFR